MIDYVSIIQENNAFNPHSYSYTKQFVSFSQDILFIIGHVSNTNTIVNTDSRASVKPRNVSTKQNGLGPVHGDLHPQPPASQLSQVSRSPKKPGRYSCNYQFTTQ